jgi:hypothetical protein
MSRLTDDRDKLTEIMIAQAQVEHGGLSPSELAHDVRELPLSVVYVDEAAQKLVVGLAGDAAEHRARHLERLLEIVGEVDLELRYVKVESHACPNKTGECRPMRSGVRVNTTGTLNLVGIHLVSGAREPFTIVSSHVVGAGVGRAVGQPAASAPYGRVTVNPSLTNRSSDAALTDINNRRIEYQTYSIWGPDESTFTVVGFNGAVAVGDPVAMQGAHSDELAEGFVTQLDVTVRDTFGVLTHQVYADYPAEGGDSGAPVFEPNFDNEAATYNGIHCGRVIDTNTGLQTPYFSTWNYISAELGVNPVDF